MPRLTKYFIQNEQFKPKHYEIFYLKLRFTVCIHSLLVIYFKYIRSGNW